MKQPHILNKRNHDPLILSDRKSFFQRLNRFILHSSLFLFTFTSTLSVFFIIFFIAKDAFPFILNESIVDFFTQTNWYPSAEPGEFGAFALFFGTFLVTLGSVLVSVPLGISAAVCLSDVIPFSMRQLIKPVIEILSAIPSVAYGFFALVIFAPILQQSGGQFLSITLWVIGLPVLTLVNIIISDLITDRYHFSSLFLSQIVVFLILESISLGLLIHVSHFLQNLTISSGTNVLNVSIILGIMTLPTVVSVSEDALQAVGREMREGSYALGATKAETILKVVIPAASSGIFAAVILGMMRALGETIVVWMASGNAAQVPQPWYDILEPVRTLTATIAGDMGEADHVFGSSRFHVLFAMAFSLLLISFFSNLASEWIIVRSRKKLKGL